MSVTGKSMLVDLARTVADVRRALGWSQRELARRAEITQSTVSRVERAKLDDLTFVTAAQLLDALGIRARLDLRAPFIADRRRQTDAGHARCVAYVARRLRRLGWSVLTEVEIVTGSARGWIDVLAYRPGDDLLLIIEIKTELEDIGMVQRQLAWYERAAWDAAHRAGWRPSRAVAALLVLETARTLERVADNRELLVLSFPMTARELGKIVAGATGAGGRSLAMIDPYVRSAYWLLRTPLFGRVREPRYADYANFMARVRSRRG
jgi:transcriptional regulator with XRE-family HTH domain